MPCIEFINACRQKDLIPNKVAHNTCDVPEIIHNTCDVPDIIHNTCDVPSQVLIVIYEIFFITIVNTAPSFDAMHRIYQCMQAKISNTQ
jgi:hypothetical protein